MSITLATSRPEDLCTALQIPGFQSHGKKEAVLKGARRSNFLFSRIHNCVKGFLYRCSDSCSDMFCMPPRFSPTQSAIDSITAWTYSGPVALVKAGLLECRGQVIFHCGFLWTKQGALCYAPVQCICYLWVQSACSGWVGTCGRRVPLEV